MKFLKHILFLVLMVLRRPLKAAGGIMAVIFAFAVPTPFFGAPVMIGVVGAVCAVLCLLAMFWLDRLILLLQPEGSRIALID